MCRCNSLSRFQRPLPFHQNNGQIGGNGNCTKAGGNSVIILGDNYAPINGGGNVNNGGIGSGNNGLGGFGGLGCGGCGGGNNQNFNLIAKMMQFFMALIAMLSFNNQGFGDTCGCGAGIDCLG